jgi:hypothetical protein
VVRKGMGYMEREEVELTCCFWMSIYKTPGDICSLIVYSDDKNRNRHMVASIHLTALKLATLSLGQLFETCSNLLQFSCQIRLSFS